MKILKSIGSFFARIWRWIKNTAWVQPLLIVGAIFGVIFSIPAITSGIQGLINDANSAETYLEKYQASMEGGYDSEAEKILRFTYDTAPDDKKFFIMFTKSGDSSLTDTKQGFDKLQVNWGGMLKPSDGRRFKLYTVFTNETTNQTTSKKSAFYQLLERNSSFFETAAKVAKDSNYYIDKKKITKEQIEKLQDADESTFITPTIILMNFNDDEEGKKAQANMGISRITFSITGSDEESKAKFLYEMWEGTGDFK